MDKQVSQNMENYIVTQPSDFQRKWHRTSVKVKLSPSMKQTEVKVMWDARLPLLIMSFLQSIAIYLHQMGDLIEFWLNTVSTNGGLAKVASMILSGRSLESVQKNSENYFSAIGHLDLRTTLDNSILTSPSMDCKGHCDRGAIIRDNPDTKWAADLCIMASKLAYENSFVIQKIVTNNWNMSMVGSYNFWNENQQRHSTQAFLFHDRQENSQIIVLAFRGTEPFNAYDWSTDFDFAWFELPQVGRLHVGFLEALGFLDRKKEHTFTEMKQKMDSTVDNSCSPSGLSEDVINDPRKPLAYDELTATIKSLLHSHKNAKLFITGHSLGGALATLFTAMLFSCKEDAVAERIAAVYTFGQPRAGNQQFANYMDAKLNTPICRYFRVVYSDDIVPRVPFDDEQFQFKHFGRCFYYNRRYIQQTREEEPNRNSSVLFYLFIPRMGAAWELVRSVIRIRDRESSFCIMFRLMGLLLPGVVAHNPANYVDAVRCGPEILNPQVLDSRSVISRLISITRLKWHGFILNKCILNMLLIIAKAGSRHPAE
ncbi:hypothetical protein O6H91_03G088600 [Diphasiastrum complanatum]|uniref:Uncharacterized protein n=1 Tax=Diphasiastrum complanatum TaxID=34168 RepID=A0ACC2E9E6_DIPCM|nr:hypothetical protein O6H91_03G088600 [Diphasiastrum complanatum]